MSEVGIRDIVVELLLIWPEAIRDLVRGEQPIEDVAERLNVVTMLLIPLFGVTGLLGAGTYELLGGEFGPRQPGMVIALAPSAFVLSLGVAMCLVVVGLTIRIRKVPGDSLFRDDERAFRLLRLIPLVVVPLGVTVWTTAMWPF